MKLEAGGKAVAEEAERAAGGERRQHAGGVAVQREGDHGEGDRGDHADAGGEPVHPVDEVDDVDHGDDPDHGQRVGDPAQLETADEGQGEDVGADPARDRDRRGADLAQQLRQRRQAAHVVDHPDRRDRGGADQDRAGLAVGGQPDPAGDLDPGEDRQAGEARHRAVVQPALLRAGRSRRSGRRGARRREPAARRSRRLRGRRGRRRWSLPFRGGPGERARPGYSDAGAA